MVYFGSSGPDSLRGEIQVEGLYYFGKYDPVVSWTTVRLMLILSINQGLDTIQVDLSNYFVQANLVEYVYLAIPYYFDSESGKYRAKMFMKLNKSLYELVQPPLYWYNNVKGTFETRSFNQFLWIPACSME